MPRRNPKEEEVHRGWRGIKGRKGRENLYQVRFDNTMTKVSSLKPGDLIEVLVRSINRRGEGEGVHGGKQVIIAGAHDPGVIVTARVKRIAEGKIYAELVEVSDEGR